MIWNFFVVNLISLALKLVWGVWVVSSHLNIRNFTLLEETTLEKCFTLHKVFSEFES